MVAATTRVIARILAAANVAHVHGSTSKVLIKGVSYGPVPLKSGVGASQLPADDWFCDEAVFLWGRSGRGDLQVMRQLGANMVRLYGNSADHDHTSFLDEALQENLSVAPGMSDFPFTQNMGNNCLHDTDFNCFTQVKPMYLQNLRKGFLTMNQEYHPSLKYMNIINEPDLKIPPDATTGGPQTIKQMCKAIISAFDAMLDAEKAAGVTGRLINFTATFSYATCLGCDWYKSKPALGQMKQLDDAMHHPSKYGYTPRNDITAAYKARFTHSFNTQNPATDIQHQFLDDYALNFVNTPVYIGEYHRVGANQTEDLDIILDLAMRNHLFLGISYFQYQVAYWKGGSEEDFGMFALGHHMRANMTYFSSHYPIFCLVPVESEESGTSLPAAVAAAYRGPGLETSTLCSANPWGVQLGFAGYSEIASQQSTPQMERFVTRLAEHLGAIVRDGQQRQLRSFADRFVGGGKKDFERLASELGSRPGWLEFNNDARCMADRGAEPGVVGDAIGWACANSPTLNCSTMIPAECEADPYRKGDFVFSHYYNRHGDKSNPLLGCSFNGAAIFASPKIFDAWTGASLCGEVVTTTATTTSTSTETTTVTSSTLTATAPSENLRKNAGSRAIPLLGSLLGLLAILATAA